MDPEIRICVRLPNWLGDTIMSLGFLQLLREAYPLAKISVITKKGLEQMVALLPGITNIYEFSKAEYKGLKGVWRFGKMLGQQQQFDLFFVLPDSFSSALMAFASGAKKRIGFGGQWRNALLTHSYSKPAGKHRVEDYASLIQQFNPQISSAQPQINLPSAERANVPPYIIININSESVTSRLPVPKAIEVISLFQQYHYPIKLIGGKKEVSFVTEVYHLLPNKSNVEIVAGKTDLQELTTLIQQAFFVISSDSGPAHIASAAHVPLVVITGAGDEKNTGPYHNNKAIAVRNGKLSCEPCVKNYCKLGPLPVCLLQINLKKIEDAAATLLPQLSEHDD